MSDLTLVGDEMRLDGETVATVVPGLRASLRYELEQSFAPTPRTSLGCCKDDLDRADYRDLSERNRETARRLRAEHCGAAEAA